MANLDWTKLGFGYRKTNTILSCSYKDGQWGPVESHTDDNLSINAFAGALHYSIECFEGLKAFRGADGKVRLFRPEENAKRLQRSANYIGIAAPSVERFIEMCIRVVKENIDFLPPYGTNASMYLRPTLIGVNPQLGVKSSTECLFLMLCAPVGAYTGNTLQPSYVVISRDYDRAAPNGTGSFKLGSNYARNQADQRRQQKDKDLAPQLLYAQPNIFGYGSHLSFHRFLLHQSTYLFFFLARK